MISLVEMAHEAREVLSSIDSEAESEFVESIIGAKRVFLSGAGRSGLIMKMFTVRLMHAGFQAYSLGDVETPSAKEGDVLILASGSGRTSLQIKIAEQAKRLNMKVLLFSYSTKSELYSLADNKLIINAPRNGESGGYVSLQPMGNLFEQCLLLCTDHIIIKIMKILNLTSEKMMEMHANLE